MDSKIEERLKHFHLTSTIDVSKDREEMHLSLRKKKLDNELKKRRVLNTSVLSAYELDCQSLTIPDHYNNKIFSSLKDYLHTVATLLSSKEDNQIFVGIILFKNHCKISDDIEIQESFLPNVLLNLLQSKINNHVIVYEITFCMVNLLSSENSKVNLQFVTVKYMECYNQLLIKYKEDMIIKTNLFNLFGNLVLGDFQIQKIFYQSKLFNIILKNLDQSEKDEKFKELNLWCLACFTQNINNNIYFYHNTEIILNLFDVFKKYAYSDKEKIIKNCLFGLDTISQYEEKDIILSFFTEEGVFLQYLMQLPLMYFYGVNAILCNLSSNNEIDDKLIKLGMIDFLMKGLQSQSNFLKSEAMWSFANLACDNNKNSIIISKGCLSYIFEAVKGYFPLLVNSGLEVLCNMIDTSHIDNLTLLYNSNISGLLLELYAKNFEQKILLKAIECILHLLEKDDLFQNKSTFLQDIEKKGGRDLFLHKSLGDNKEIRDKSIQIVDTYFNRDSIMSE